MARCDLHQALLDDNAAHTYKIGIVSQNWYIRHGDVVNLKD